MLLSIAWKNIWRNKSRSLIIITAIALGLAGIIFTIGLTEGMLQQRTRIVIQAHLSHIRIQSPSFGNNYKISDTIPNLKSVVKTLKKQKFVRAYSPRMVVSAMASSAYASSGILAVGINPKLDAHTFKLKEYLTQNSSYLTDSKARNPIIIGRKLAMRLKLVSYKITGKTLEKLSQIGLPQSVIDALKPLENKYFHTSTPFFDSLRNHLTQNQYNTYADIVADYAKKYKLRHKIVLSFQDVHGNLVQDAFTVIGVYNTNDDNFDGFYTFLPKKLLAKLTGLNPNSAHRIYVLTDNQDNIPVYTAKLKKLFPGLQVKNAFQIDPFLSVSKDMIGIYYLIFEIIILLALSFGIINTMLMAVLERTKEIGMLMAIGMNKKRVFYMISWETLLLTITGAVIGILLGLLLVDIFNKTGINLSKYVKQGFQNLGFNAIVYPVIHIKQIIETSILVIVTAIIGSVYPALKAISLDPAQALHTDV